MHLKNILPYAAALPYSAHATYDRSFTDHIAVSDILSSRDNAILCGIQNGNTTCPTGYCCSATGICGTSRFYCDAPTCQFEYAALCDANETPAGTNTTGIPRPLLGTLLYGGAGIRSCTVPGTVALTYDDGPYIYTSDLLDLLKANNAVATFFITGNNFNKHQINNASTPYPNMIRRMHAEGHQVGSHTWSHQDLELITHQECMDQMVKNEMAFVDILGFFPTYMRPPYDSCRSGKSGCQNDMTNLGYHLINYNLDTVDYLDNTPSLVQVSKDNVSRIIGSSDVTNQAFIIYSHDIYDQTVHNLTASVIQSVKAKGYKFVTVGDCLADPRVNWYRNATTGDAVTESVAWSAAAMSSSAYTSGPSGSSSTSNYGSETGSNSGTSSSSKSAAAGVLAMSWALPAVFAGIIGVFVTM